MEKEAKPDVPVLDLIAKRWSPYGFDPRPMERADITALFEAARWAPSSFNEQPWRFIVASREDARAFETVLSCLKEGNQKWAQKASVLALSVAQMHFTRNDKPNRVATHDIGLAVGNLVMEATARGLAVHQMAGILLDKVREVFEVPEGFEPVTGLAIGYAADPDTLPDELREKDLKQRTRKPLGEFVFTGQWGRPAFFVESGSA